MESTKVKDEQGENPTRRKGETEMKKRQYDADTKMKNEEIERDTRSLAREEFLLPGVRRKTLEWCSNKSRWKIASPRGCRSFLTPSSRLFLTHAIRGSRTSLAQPGSIVQTFLFLSPSFSFFISRDSLLSSTPYSAPSRRSIGDFNAVFSPNGISSHNALRVHVPNVIATLRSAARFYRTRVTSWLPWNKYCLLHMLRRR